MKIVYSSPNFALVVHFRTLLEGEGIACRIRNEFLSGAAGELPPVECWPELYVEEALESAARRVIAGAQREPGLACAAWTCAGCGELMEGQFTDCWNCGRSRDG